MQLFRQINENLKLSHKEIFLVFFPLVIQLIFAGLLAGLLTDADRQVTREAASKSLIADVQQLNYLMMSVGVSTSVYAMTKSNKAEKRVNDLFDQMSMVLRQLKTKSLTNSEEQEILHHVEELISKENRLKLEIQQMLDRGGRELNLIMSGDLLREIVYLADQVSNDLDKFVEIERASRLGTPESAVKARRNVQFLLIVFVLLNVALAIVLTCYFSNATVKRLRSLMVNMRRLADRQELNPPLAGKDEIAEVDHFFHEMAERLQELDKVKRDFFAMASHDLRSPLGSLKLFLGSMREGLYGKLTVLGEERVLSMERSIKRMVRLISDLLDLEKLEQGKLDIHLEPVQLNLIIGESMEAVRDLAAKKSIDFKSTDNDVVVMADSERIIQVMVNLLSNAIKFSPERGTVTVLVETQNSRSVTVSVQDQGPGIPADKKEMVFERFRQIHSPAKTKQSGTGLGLPICKEIIRLHNNSIGVESNPGSGSCFWFTLNLVPDQIQS